MLDMARHPWPGILPSTPRPRARVEAPAIVAGWDGGGDEGAGWGGEPTPAGMGWGAAAGILGMG